MKLLKRNIEFLVFALLFLPLAANAASDPPCKAKEEEIRQKLEIAKDREDTQRIRGLERALFSVNTWCSERDLLADAEKNVAEKRAKVDERQEDLRESIADQDGERKIAKRRLKLKEAEAELSEAIHERDALR